MQRVFICKIMKNLVYNNLFSSKNVKKALSVTTSRLSYGLSVVGILTKIAYVIIVLHCVSLQTHGYIEIFNWSPILGQREGNATVILPVSFKHQNKREDYAQVLCDKSTCFSTGGGEKTGFTKTWN